MKFVIVDPFGITTKVVSVRSIEEAKAVAELGECDHGMVYRNVGIVVEEFGLFAKPDQQRYFAMCGNLYAGRAVLYGVDTETGETVDLPSCPPVAFFKDADAVEAAIAAGTVVRPTVSVNGTVFWQWPGDGSTGPEVVERVAGA